MLLHQLKYCIFNWSLGLFYNKVIGLTSLIDKFDERLTYAESHIDVGVLKGNAISIRILEEAGIRQADLLICATSSEETNITTALLGKHLGAKRTIVRITNPEFQSKKEKVVRAS